MTHHPDYFSAQSSDYARYRPQYPEQLFDFLASIVAKHDRAWDCGAGSGQATQGLSTRFTHVVATDASLAQARSAAADRRVDWLVARAEHAPLRDASVDLLTVAQALHWFKLPAFCAEARRVVRKAGVVAVWTYGRFSVDPAVDEVIDPWYRDVIGPYWPAARRHVEDGYQSMALPFTALPSPEFALAASWTLEELLGYLGTWSAVALYRQKCGHDPRDALLGELESAWGDSTEERVVRWPISLRAGRMG